MRMRRRNLEIPMTKRVSDHPTKDSNPLFPFFSFAIRLIEISSKANVFLVNKSRTNKEKMENFQNKTAKEVTTKQEVKVFQNTSSTKRHI